MQHLQNILREVSSWPPKERRALAAYLLQSLQQEEEESATVSRERQEALRRLIGIWKTQPPPNDEQVKQILDRERMKKYG